MLGMALVHDPVVGHYLIALTPSSKLVGVDLSAEIFQWPPVLPAPTSLATEVRRCLLFPPPDDVFVLELLQAEQIRPVVKKSHPLVFGGFFSSTTRFTHAISSLSLFL